MKRTLLFLLLGGILIALLLAGCDTVTPPTDNPDADPNAAFLDATTVLTRAQGEDAAAAYEAGTTYGTLTQALGKATALLHSPVSGYYVEYALSDGSALRFFVEGEGLSDETKTTSVVLSDRIYPTPTVEQFLPFRKNETTRQQIQTEVGAPYGSAGSGVIREVYKTTEGILISIGYNENDTVKEVGIIDPTQVKADATWWPSGAILDYPSFAALAELIQP